MCQTWRYLGGLTEALQSTPCKPDTFRVCVGEVTTYIESQIMVLKQSIPPLPFSTGKALGARLKRGPHLGVRCRELAIKRLGTVLPPDHRKLQISQRTKTSERGERLGLKFFNIKKTWDRYFTSIVGDAHARKMFHRFLALQPAPKTVCFCFLLSLIVKNKGGIWVMATLPKPVLDWCNSLSVWSWTNPA